MVLNIRTIEHYKEKIGEYLTVDLAMIFWVWYEKHKNKNEDKLENIQI